MPSLSLEPTAWAMPPNSCLENDGFPAQSPDFCPVDYVSPSFFLDDWQPVSRPCPPLMKDGLWRGEPLPDEMAQYVCFGTQINGQPPSEANRDSIWRCQRLMAADRSQGDQALCPPAMDAWDQPLGRCGTLIRSASGEPAANAEQHCVESVCHAAADHETTKEEAAIDFGATPPGSTPAMRPFAALGCESPNRGTDASAAALVLDPASSTSPPDGLEAVIPFGTTPRQAAEGSVPSYEDWDAYDDLLYVLFHPPQGDPACPLLSIDDIDALFDGMVSSPVTSTGTNVDNRDKEAATRPSPAMLICGGRSPPAWSHGSDSDTDSDLPTLEDLISSIPYRKRVLESGRSITDPIDLTME